MHLDFGPLHMYGKEGAGGGDGFSNLGCSFGFVQAVE